MRLRDETDETVKYERKHKPGQKFSVFCKKLGQNEAKKLLITDISY